MDTVAGLENRMAAPDNKAKQGPLASVAVRLRLWIGTDHRAVRAFAVVWAAGVLLPMLLVIGLSFLRTRGVRIEWVLSLDAYDDILETGRWEVVLRTLRVASVVTALCLVAGFPFALWLAKRAKSGRLVNFVQLCLTVPFFLDPSARIIVWRAVLGTAGFVNAALLTLHLTTAPVEWLLFSDFAVYLGLIGPYFPNMVWPIYLAIVLIDDELLKASADLGASPAATLRYIVIPLAVPGLIAGTIFTFIPILGDSVVPTLLGGGKKEYIADSVMALSTSMNYAVAAAMAAIVLMLLGLLLILFWTGGRGVDALRTRAIEAIP
jgi:ABC-type spermidine/putrescine transport system permease subunit I